MTSNVYFVDQNSKIGDTIEDVGEYIADALDYWFDSMVEGDTVPATIIINDTDGRTVVVLTHIETIARNQEGYPCYGRVAVTRFPCHAEPTIETRFVGIEPELSPLHDWTTV